MRVTDAYNFDAWGDEVGQIGASTNPHKFVGSKGYYSDDDSGLMLLGARYYDPAIGRFITQDPDRDGWNWYAYAANNPVGNIDPDGMAPKKGANRPTPSVAWVEQHTEATHRKGLGQIPNHAWLEFRNGAWTMEQGDIGKRRLDAWGLMPVGPERDILPRRGTIAREVKGRYVDRDGYTPEELKPSADHSWIVIMRKTTDPKKIAQIRSNVEADLANDKAGGILYFPLTLNVCYTWCGKMWGPDAVSSSPPAFAPDPSFSKYRFAR